MTRRQKIFVYVIPTCLSGLFLILAIRNLNLSDFLHLMGSVDIRLLVAALAIVALNSILRAFRWQTLLTPDHDVRLSDVYWAMMIGYLGNAYLPARIGEFLRAYALGRKTSLSSVKIFSTAIVERVLDALFLVGTGWLALQFLRIPGSLFLAASQNVLIVMAILICGLLVLTWYGGRTATLLRKIPIDARVRKFVVQHWDNFNQGLTTLNRPRMAALFFFCTVLIWSIDVLASILISLSLGLEFNVATAFFLISMLGLSSAIPSTPGGVGVLQFVTVSVLSPLGFNTNQSLAFILIYQMISYLHITTFGLLGVWQTGIRLSPGLLAEPKPATWSDSDH
ncbi:MAG: hypothetical protein RIR52_1961 [Acidobacteriota bacterium]|jgi:uncharacterized protein (TIRG00374 family)